MISENISKEQMKSKVDFENLKSDYFLQKTFDILKRNKSLNIIKYNKKLQNRLNLGIKDYKEYSQFYTLIEIELKLVDNKYDKFINISDKEKKYFHIYFNNANEEIQRNYLNQNEKVDTIKLIIDYQIKSFKELFERCDCLRAIHFKKFYRINISDMSRMFFECSSLQEINLSSFNTINVTNMSFMFAKCSSLIELNLSNFNTSKVNNMYGMFAGCLMLKELNLSNFVVNKYTDMGNFIWGCSFDLRKKVKSQNKKIKC